ncbi:2-dehydropantoate 2-reductase [Sporodiniella umbellata]|nr:2-dehydropantoate 2-reductase [Sporodiniella umbellata]
MRLYSTENPPRVLTVGTGAVGAIYSWRLSQSCEITTVCRSSYQTVLENGFDINSAKFGLDKFRPHKVVRSVEECKDKVFDYVLVTLKVLPEVYNIADIIAPVIKDEKTTIVLIQNGLGIEEPIVERFPNNPIISIVAYIGVSQHHPGKITMLGGESLSVGKYLKAQCKSDEQHQKFLEYLKKGGVDAQSVEDIEKLRWQKLFWNSCFSPVCTLTGMNTTELLANKEATKAVKDLMHEVIMTANAEGYDFNEQEQIETMMLKTKQTAENYKPSMQLDKENAKPMEIEAILGAPLKRAKARGLSVPRLETVHSICSAANQHILNSFKK